MNKKVGLILLMVICLTLTLNMSVHVYAGNANLLENPGFEEADGNYPMNWGNKNDQLPEGVTIEVSSTDPHSGSKCLLINNAKPADTMLVQSVKLKADKVYHVICWLKTENITQQAGSANMTLLYLKPTGEIEGIITTQEFANTNNQWTKLEYTFRTLKTDTPLKIGLRLGGQGTANQGKVYFDDLALTEGTATGDTMWFYVPNPPPSTETTQTPAGPSFLSILISKLNLYVVVGTLLVGLLIFLEFKLAGKERKERAEAEAQRQKDSQENINNNDQIDGAFEEAVAEAENNPDVEPKID